MDDHDHRHAAVGDVGMTSPQKRKGDREERAVRDYLADGGFPVDKLRAGHAEDHGDLRTPLFTLQVKNQKRISVVPWWDATVEQAANAGSKFAGLVIHVHGRGVSQDLFVTDLATARNLLHFAHDYLTATPKNGAGR